MPAKRKAAQKAAVPAESSRPTRSAENKAGSKRKASPSPAPPAKKGVGARRGATETDAKDTKETSRQSARGRSASKQTEEPKPARGGSRTATRSAVVAEETKKAASRGRSKTPSTPQKKTQSTPKSTPKTRTETPKQKATPTQKAATPRQRSATPKSKPSTPKQKAATPKQKAVTPKQKNVTPKQKTATPKAKQEKQKSTPKQKPTPKAKQKSTPVKTPVKKTPEKKKESPKKDKEEESNTEPEKSPDSAKKRKSPAKRETPPSKPARASSRSRGREEKAEEEIKDDKEQTDQTAEEEPAENTSTEAAKTEPEQTASDKQEDTETNDEDVAEKPEEKTAEIDQGKPEQEDKEDEEEAMETGEAGNEDENVEQDQIVEKNESAESEEAAVEESKESEPVQDKAETIEEDAEVEKVEAKMVETENVEAENEDIEEVQETENTEADNVEEKMEDNEDPLAVDEQVEDVQSTEADKPADPEPVSIEAEPEVPNQKEVDDVKESQAESEQVVIADNENDVVESEQVEADNPEPQSNTAAGDPIVINEDSGDSAQPEVISDDSENGEGKVIEVNDDSGDAVIVMDSSEVGSGDNADKANEVQQVNAEAEQQVVNLDDETGVELAEEAIENDFAATSDSTTGNGTSHLEDGESKKRKIDDVEDAEESGEFSKKLKSSVEVENVTENGSVSQEEGNDDDDFVVIEMSDMPPVDSSEIKESIPQEVVNTNNIDNSVNPIFNREFVPNPAFSGQADASKQFSVVSYNILADCHLFRNDYSFTDSKYLVPEYRLEKIIEELKYLDGDVICMQEVDPSFFSEKLLPSLQSIGYEGFHKKREADYFNEGEATFYKTGRFTLVECQLHRQSELVEKVLSEGAMDPSIQDAVRKYVDMPDVLVITKLRCNNTGSELTVGNVHINWGEMKTPDIQCVQIASAIREALSRAGSDSVPHIICGDFNSPPLSPGYVVARDGYPNGDETITRLQQITGLQLPEGKVDSLVNCLWPAFQHTSSALKSAYFEAQGREPEITSYNQVMCECVDYIFYSSTSIDNVGVFRVADKQKIMETGGTPNIYFPSDHVSMKAVLAFK